MSVNERIEKYYNDIDFKPKNLKLERSDQGRAQIIRLWQNGFRFSQNAYQLRLKSKVHLGIAKSREP